MLRDDNDFSLWMRTVDSAVRIMAHVSVHDLPDAPFRDWFDDGVKALTAAKRVIRSAKFEMGLL